MLVSSIARFDALNTMNNAAYNSMQASNSMMNLVENAHAFSGERNLGMLNKLENQIVMDLETGNLLYKIALMQAKMAAKQQKNSFNFIA